MLEVCSSNSVTLSDKSGVTTDNTDRPVRGTACYASYMYCGSTTDGTIAQLNGVV